MKIEELKSQIESKTLSNDMLILISKPENFIVHQYINEIASFRHLRVSFVDGIPGVNLFGEEDSLLYVFITEKFESTAERDNCIVVCQKIGKSVSKDRTVEIPSLEDWQLKDFTAQKLPGVTEKNIEIMSSIIKNPFRLSMEIDKISIFPVGVQNSIFEEILNSGGYSDIATAMIFDFSNAVFKGDIETVKRVYRQIEECRIEPVQFSAVVYSNIRNMIMVALQKYPTEENTGMKQGQIYAVKKSAQRFNREQILKLFDEASDIDKKLKTGELPASEIIDYLMIRVLNA